MWAPQNKWGIYPECRYSMFIPDHPEVANNSFIVKRANATSFNEAGLPEYDDKVFKCNLYSE